MRVRAGLAVLLTAVCVAGCVSACSSSTGTGLGSSQPTSSQPASSQPTSSQPTSSEATSSPPASSSGSAQGATASEVSFVVDGTTTYGTLTVPAHASGRRVAGALLLQGSGPGDRDGNEAGHGTPDTLKLISDLLVGQGIATLRFDKYFSGKTGAGKLADDPAAVTISIDLRQTVAAYDFLAEQSVVDPAKLLVVGHSEGGMLALNIAADAATKPAGLALLEPQDLRSLALVYLQIVGILDSYIASGDIPASDRSSNVTAVATAITAYRNGQTVTGDGLAPQLKQALLPLLSDNPTPQYGRTWDRIVPARLAARVEAGTRVLVTSGSRDTNVPPNTFGPLVAALTSAGTTGPGLVRIDGTDHYMHLADQPDDQPLLAPAIVSAIEQWAKPFSS